MARALKTPITVEEIKDGELYGVVTKALGESAPLSDSVMKQKIAVAEDAIERDLQIKFQPTRVYTDVYGRQTGTFPSGGPADLPDDYSNLTDIAEPAYDYASEFWGDERWGGLNLNYRPVRSLGRMFFAFPGTRPVWEVPQDWFRLDQKFGFLQIVPTHQQAVYATFDAFIVGVLAGTRSLPQSIFIDYVVGLSHAEMRANHEDLLELVRIQATLSILGIVQVAVSPGGAMSNSLSIDGLSRSRGFGGKYGPYSGRIELAMEHAREIRESWRRKEKGVPMVYA